VAIPNTVLFVNGKGGVLKTTAAAHLAGYAATSGWDVLVIDADAQANQSRDLGYVPDGGVALAAALTGEGPLVPIRHDKWDTLSFVPGGPAVDDALGKLTSELGRGKVAAVRAFERALTPIAADYHLIVIDSPPRELLLRKILFAAGRFIVVPCQVDEGSIDGVAGVFETAAEVRDAEGLNPDLEILGAFLGPIQNGANKTERLTRQRMNALVGDDGFVFTTTIRSAQSIAAYCRQHGVLTNEYEQIAADVKANGRRWFRMSKEERAKAREEHTCSEAAPGLAADWENLVGEIMARFQERLAAGGPEQLAAAGGNG
jgi:chromosome partitioning protein